MEPLISPDIEISEGVQPDPETRDAPGTYWALHPGQQQNGPGECLVPLCANMEGVGYEDCDVILAQDRSLDNIASSRLDSSSSDSLTSFADSLDTSSFCSISGSDSGYSTDREVSQCSNLLSRTSYSVTGGASFRTCLIGCLFFRDVESIPHRHHPLSLSPNCQSLHVHLHIRATPV